MRNCNCNGSTWCQYCQCRPPIIIKCPTGPTGNTGPTGPTGPTATR